MKDFSVISKDQKDSFPEKLREILLKVVLSSLCRTVDHRCFSIVDKCLRHKSRAGDSDHLPQNSKEDKLSRQMRFDEDVVGQLAKCSA